MQKINDEKLIDKWRNGYMDMILERNPQKQQVSVKANSVNLQGDLVIPENALGIILFANGSGSNRNSYRSRYFAEVLHQERLATLLIDLLTSEEVNNMRTRHLCFDVDLLASRLVNATDWLLQNPLTHHLKIGYFGASTGSAAALIAATQRPEAVWAIVSRSGRPDLAGSNLSRIQAPTLLIVGGNDSPVIDINQDALKLIHAENRLEIILGTTHLLKEPGALENVAALARQWFNRYLTAIAQDIEPSH
jgi:putative phosphoribosyl transferase